jgi:hypothetical protein
LENLVGIKKLSLEILMDVKSLFTKFDMGLVKISKYVFVLKF